MWIWTGGDKGSKGGKGGGKSGGRPPNLGKGAQPNRRHYIQCNTTGCNGHVFQVHGKEMPEKCKVCNLCGIPFVIPILPAIGAGSKGNAGKGGSQNPIKKKKEEDAAAAAPSPLSAAASVAPGKITDFFENLKEHGYSEEAALEQLTALGLKLLKKVLPKTVDEYDRLASINREIKRCQNDISGQSEKYYRLGRLQKTYSIRFWRSNLNWLTLMQSKWHYTNRSLKPAQLLRASMIRHPSMQCCRQNWITYQ